MTLARGGLARDRQRGKRPKKPGEPNRGHPIMFGFREAEHFGDLPEGGGYPRGFLARAFAVLEVSDAEGVLHVCSGSVRSGVRVDRRADHGPSVVAEALTLPFRAGSFEIVMVDPPYAESYAETLYGLGSVYPRPGTLLREIARVTAPGGRIGFMHHVVPKWQKCGLRLRAVYGITQGPGYAIRAWSVFDRIQETP